MASQLVKRVVVVGAESTGKTSLVQALAEQTDAVVVLEELRRFVTEHGRVPSRQEQQSVMVAQIAAEQAAEQQALTQGAGLVLCDCSAIMTAVYSEFYYGDDSLYAQALGHHQQVAMTLFCQPDLPWVADPGQRDGKPAREAVHALLSRRLASIDTAVVPIVGAGDGRVRLALRALTALH
jgi:nicotinamide riboside kinase